MLRCDARFGTLIEDVHGVCRPSRARWFTGRRLRSAAASGVLVAAVGAVTVPDVAGAATVCVGGGPPCLSTLQAAVDAAHDGDTIALNAGTFAGGVTIDKSVDVVGVGARSSIIKGGAPVLTLGHFEGANEPTISLSDRD
jgi:hypothetical protein